MVLTTHSHPAPRLWKSSAILVPRRPLCVCTTCYWEIFTFTIKVFNSYSCSLNYSLHDKIYQNYICKLLFKKFGLFFKWRLTRYKEPMQGDVSYFPAVFNHMKLCIYMRANMFGLFICIISVLVIKWFNKIFIFHFWCPVVLHKELPFERWQDYFL